MTSSLYDTSPAPASAAPAPAPIAPSASLYDVVAPAPVKPAPVQSKPAPAPAAVTAPAPVATTAADSGDVDATTTDAAEGDTDATTEEPAPAITAEVLAKAIEKGIPKIIRQQRVEDARQLYSPQDALADALPDSAFAAEGLAPDLQVVLAAETRAIAADMAMTPADVDLVRSALREVQTNPLTDEQRITARDEAIQALNSEYGNEAAAALRDARKFIAADPRRAALLQSVGDDPRVVLKIAQLARAARSAGRL